MLRSGIRPHRYLLLPMFACGLLVACGGSASTDGGQGGLGGSGQGGSSTPGNGGTTGGGGTTATAGAGGSVGSGGIAGSASGSAGSGGGSVAGGTGAAGRGGSGGSGGSPPGGAAGTSAAGRGGNAGSASGSGGSGTGVAGVGGGAMPSAGCGMANPPASGRYTIDVSGTAREYIIKMPAGYNKTRPYRLIFAFHGAMYDAASVDAGGAPSPSGPYYGIEPLAGGSAIFVAPDAFSSSDRWANSNGRDVAFVNAMITRFESQLCIDQSRIFATGFSVGAMMTISLGCTEPDQFRAIAPMSGQLRGTCSPSAPLAYWASHGLQDTTITPTNGEMARDVFRTRNGCTINTMPGDRAGCVDYQGCSAGHPVTWCSFTGTHMPPPFSGEAIWAFFSRF